MKNDNVKKRLMYISNEDFYLYCYSIFIILDSLGCYGKKHFRDYRKLSFLINIINNNKTTDVIMNSSEKKQNIKDREILLDSYTSGLIKRSEILKLLFILDKKNYIRIEKGREQEINLHLKKENLPQNFLSKKKFNSEYNNIGHISKKIQRLSSLKLDTMVNSIYEINGVKTWGQ